MSEHAATHPLLLKLARIENLPSLPDVLQRIDTVARDPESDARAVAAVIETDPPLAARVLRVANSVYYFLGNQPIASVQRAVARLGMREVCKLCLTITAMRLFVRSSRVIDHRACWHHALTVAATTRAIARLGHRRGLEPESAYLAGLLHDIGALVLDQFFPEHYALVHQRLAQQPADPAVVERDLLGIDHAEVGAALLERWQLPSSLVAAVRYHHDPEAAPEEYRPLCQLVHLTDYACTRQGVPGPGESELASVSGEAWRDLGLQPIDFLDMLDEILHEAERSRVFLEVAV